jgi:hypothetical protein
VAVAGADEVVDVEVHRLQREALAHDDPVVLFVPLGWQRLVLDFLAFVAEERHGWRMTLKCETDCCEATLFRKIQTKARCKNGQVHFLINNVKQTIGFLYLFY